MRKLYFFIKAFVPGPAKYVDKILHLYAFMCYVLLLTCNFFLIFVVISKMALSSFVPPPFRLIQFPPPPLKGGITVTMEDLQCLDSGQFLNDVIIDFYLKWVTLF